MKKALLVFSALLAAGCIPEYMASPRVAPRIVPAEEFSKSMRDGSQHDFSIFRVPETDPAAPRTSSGRQTALLASNQPAAGVVTDGRSVPGDPRYLNQGFALKSSTPISSATLTPEETAGLTRTAQTNQLAALPGSSAAAYVPPGPPAGSSSPYINGQMTSNPSLWPDEGQGAALFRDFRAFQSMDVVTIIINDNTIGERKADTDAKSKFSLTAAIKNFFGLETSKWKSNNEGLDPENLINASTNSEFKGEGDTKREGTLKARISAVIMELFPNGLLRIEGTKIISVNNEEEVMVISGLVRQRDIDAFNQVDSSRIANLRVDLYGRGVLGDQQQPGWGSRLFELIWPF